MRRLLLILSAVLLLAAPAAEARPEPEPGSRWGTLLEEWTDRLVGDLLAVFHSDPVERGRVPAAYAGSESGAGGEIGPRMDPNGATTSSPSGEIGPYMDPNGATEPPDSGEIGPHMDPNG